VLEELVSGRSSAGVRDGSSHPSNQCNKDDTHTSTKLAVRSGDVVNIMEKSVFKSEDTKEELQLKVYRIISAIAFTSYYPK
jgi:hypothetical protein